jgi:hypothetical protein
VRDARESTLQAESIDPFDFAQGRLSAAKNAAQDDTCLLETTLLVSQQFLVTEGTTEDSSD